LEALAADRVGELVVAFDLSMPGGECGSCGRLAVGAGSCPSCGAAMTEVPDVVEMAVARAFRQGCRVETVVHANGLHALGDIGAILRF
jgi:peptide subunit release factor 1 (eRF1)